MDATLLELLDRLLDKGVMVKGEILLSVADIDLVYLNLGLLLSSVKTVQPGRGQEGRGDPRGRPAAPPQPSIVEGRGLPSSFPASGCPRGRPAREDTLPLSIDHELDHRLMPKTNIDPQNVEKGLAKLVLTLVELLRQLMEKQAVRRVEAGQLQESDVERLGATFFLLDEKMEQLKQVFGLADEDLNIDLGPLGTLL